MSRWLRLLGAFGVCLLVIFVPAGSRPDASQTAFAQLRVSGPLEMAPYAYLDNSGVYTGFSVNMLQSLGQKLGVETLLFYPATQPESLQALADGELDCIHCVRYSPALAQGFTFAALYLETPSIIFISRQRFDIANLQDLAGKRVAILEDEPAAKRLAQIPHLRLTPVGNLDRGFFLLRTGQIDALVGERLTALRFLDEHNQNRWFKTVGREVAWSRFGLLVRKDQRELAKRLAAALSEMNRSGERDRIFKQWFGEGFQPQTPLSQRVIRWVFVFVGGSLLVAMLVLGWNLLLQRELEIKAIAIKNAKLDQTIAEEKSRFEAIVQSMTEGLMLVDPGGHIAYVNARGALHLGRRVEDLLGKPLSAWKEYLFTLVTEREHLARKLEYAEQNPARQAVIEYAVITTRRQDIRLKLFPVRDRQGKFAGRGVLIEDLTHQREIERLKSEFVSIVSHELRTPMTSILGFSELILTQDLPKDLNRRYAEQIHGEAKRLTRILNDILDISYLESGEGVLKKKEIRVSEVVKEVVESFNAQIRDRREVRIGIDARDGLICADRDKLSQVIWNLLSNADKYSPSGKEVIIEVIHHERPDPGWGISAEETENLVPAVELKVTDFGQGIPADQLSLIFVPFHRVETAVHTIRGTGLGLAIVKRIVEAHNGRVWARSEPGKKTVFSVLLPLRPLKTV